MATMELDISRLSAFCSLPQSSIIALRDEPTPELIRSLFTNIFNKAFELDEAKSQQLKLNIELENAVRGGASKARVLKSSIEKGQKEVVELKKKLELEGMNYFISQAILSNKDLPQRSQGEPQNQSLKHSRSQHQLRL